MKDAWLRECFRLSRHPADFYSGCRKILRNRSLSFDRLDSSLLLSDAGYAINKLRQLERHYVHAESRDAAIKLWEQRLAKDKYGSVSFHCYNHYVKSEKKSPRGSVMGPCLLTVVLTYIDSKHQEVNCFYRTTELFKKFPADLVFIRDVLLEDIPITGPINFHFANITLHPMYFVIPLGATDAMFHHLRDIKSADPYFHDWIVKWTARYLCPEHSRGIQKFSQALRVQKSALEKITGTRLKTLLKYLREYHPGHRNNYEDDDAETDS